MENLEIWEKLCKLGKKLKFENCENIWKFTRNSQIWKKNGNLYI